MNFLLLDLLIFGGIALFLYFRYKGILGTKHGEERERKTIFDIKKDDKKSTASKSKDDAHLKDDSPMTPKDFIQSTGNKNIDATLTKISLKDRGFTPHDFINGAKYAFELIVEAFAKGDKETLEPLLSGELMDSFESVIDDRAEKGHILHTDIINVKKAEITEAGVFANKASVTVSFTAEEVKVMKNTDGEILMGDPDQIHEITDIWTFTKDLDTQDPNWILTATRTQ